MSKKKPPARTLEHVYERIHGILTAARHQAYQAINSAMVPACWDIGRVTVEEEQQRVVKAEYGQKIVDELSLRLTTDFGKGFDRSNLFHMRAFFLAYPKVDALRRQLSWTHYRVLLRVNRGPVTPGRGASCK